MAIALDTETLEQVAQDGHMVYDKWPAILEPLLESLTNTVYNDFPTPRPYPAVNPPLRRASSPSQPQNEAPSTTTTQQSTSQVPSTPARNLPPVPPFPGSSASNTSRITDSQPADSTTLPRPLQQLLDGIVHNIRLYFLRYPPHTIQRLAELILYPNHHYKTLPAWLRAVDRVISVSSTADIFPLAEKPSQVNGVNGDGILSAGHAASDLGSDESLGGALLTPIPWLRTQHASSISEDSANGEEDELGEPIETTAVTVAVTGNGHPLVPEREDGAVTQGELIRQEQEAGVVPVGPGGRDENGRTIANGVGRVAGGTEMDEEGENMPHARGPDVVGTVDMGLVNGREREVNIGSPPAEGGMTLDVDVNDAQEVLHGSGREANLEPSIDATASQEDGDMEVDNKPTVDNTPQPRQPRADDQPDSDGDIVLVDADGNTEEERQIEDETGRNAGPAVSEASTMS